MEIPAPIGVSELQHGGWSVLNHPLALPSPQALQRKRVYPKKSPLRS